MSPTEEERFRELLVQARDLVAINPKGSLAALKSLRSEVATSISAITGQPLPEAPQPASALSEAGASLLSEIQARRAAGK